MEIEDITCGRCGQEISSYAKLVYGPVDHIMREMILEFFSKELENNTEDNVLKCTFSFIPEMFQENTNFTVYVDGLYQTEEARIMLVERDMDSAIDIEEYPTPDLVTIFHHYWSWRTLTRKGRTRRKKGE